MVRNEVALDYNAGLVATLAALAMGADRQPPVAPPAPAAPPSAPPLWLQPPHAPPQPSDGCCLWPRPPDPAASCANCTIFAATDNWLDLAEDNCRSRVNPFNYTWCRAPPPPPRGPAAPAAWSAIVFALEVLVALSSLVAALASVEKLFVLYTWSYFKLHPEAAPEHRWKCHR